MRRVGIYCRVSTDEQARVEEGSIKNQIEALTKYIEAENLKDNGKWGALVGVYKDEGFSAKSLSRPDLKQLLIDISKEKINTVLITEISRMSRSVRDWIDLRAFFEDHGASFISARQRFDTSTAMGRAMLNFAIEFAQLEREMTVERVKVSYVSRASRGLWPGGPIPYGLDKTDRPGYLQVSAAKQIIANEILDIFLNRAGYVTKALELIRGAGYVRDRGIAWDDNSLCRWIRNRALIGEVEINEKNKGRDQTHIPESDRHRVVPAVWPPVVDRELWLRANELLDRNHRMLKVPQWKYNEFLLTGLLQCPNGVSLTGASGHGRSGDKYSYYRHQKKCSCHFSSISGHDVEKVVFKKLTEVAQTDDVIDALVDQANAEFKKSRPNHRETIAATKRRVDTLASHLDRVTDEILSAPSAEARRMWTEKSFRLQAEKDQLEREIQLLKNQEHGTAAQTIDRDAIKTALTAFTSDFERLPFAARRGLVTSLVDSVRVEKDEVVLNLKSPGPKWQKKSPVLCESGDRFLDDRFNWGDLRGLSHFNCLSQIRT